MSRSPKSKGLVIVASVVLSTLALAGCSSEQKDQDASAAAQNGSLPTGETAFLKIVADGQKKADKDNGVAVEEAKKRRGTAISALLGKKLVVSDWVGQVEKIDKTG